MFDTYPVLLSIVHDYSEYSSCTSFNNNSQTFPLGIISYIYRKFINSLKAFLVLLISVIFVLHVYINNSWPISIQFSCMYKQLMNLITSYVVLHVQAIREYSQCIFWVYTSIYFMTESVLVRNISVINEYLQNFSCTACTGSSWKFSIGFCTKCISSSWPSSVFFLYEIYQQFMNIFIFLTKYISDLWTFSKLFQHYMRQ